MSLRAKTVICDVRLKEMTVTRALSLISMAALVVMTASCGKNPVAYQAPPTEEHVTIEEMVKEPPVQGVTPLHRAARDGDEQRIRSLLADGANVNAMTSLQEPPLFFAAERNQAGAVRVLLDAGADPNIRDVNGRTPLCELIGRDYSPSNIVRMLLDAGGESHLRFGDRKVWHIPATPENEWIRKELGLPKPPQLDGKVRTVTKSNTAIDSDKK